MNFNSPLESLLIRAKLYKYHVFDATYSNVDLTKINPNYIVFDFTDDKFVHLGDILFFLPIIINLSRYQNLYLVCNGVKRDLLNVIFYNQPNISILSNIPSSATLLICPANAFISSLKYNLPAIGLGNPEFTPNLAYPFFLLNLFSKIIPITNSLDASNYFWRWIRNHFLSTQRKKIRENIILVSPYLASGKFRDIFSLKQKKIIDHANSIAANLNAKIVLVGSSSDSFLHISDDQIDLRGFNIKSVIEFVLTANTLCGVGFDNFWMHFFDLIGLDYYVKFRGRFLSSAKKLHFNSVNISYLRSKKRNYI